MKKKQDEEEEENADQKEPKKKAKKVAPRKAERVAKPETGKRPLSVDGIVNKGVGKERPWEKNAPWNRKDPKRNSRFEHARTASNNKD